MSNGEAVNMPCATKQLKCWESHILGTLKWNHLEIWLHGETTFPNFVLLTLRAFH